MIDQPAYQTQLKLQSGALALTVIINILFLYLFQTAGAWLVLQLLQVTGFSVFSLEMINELYTLLVYLVAFLLPYLIYAKAANFSLQTIPRDLPHPPVLTASVGVALGISVAGLVVSALVCLLLALFGWYPNLPIPEMPADAPAAILYMVNCTLVPAVVEELINRGIILGSLRRFGERFAIVISALIFALLHRNLAQIPNAFLMGLALGYFVVKTNSIWTGVVIHFVNNLLVMLISIFADYMQESAAILLQGLLLITYLAACAGGLYYLLRIRRVDLSLAPSSYPLGERALYDGFLRNVPMIMMLLLFGWVIYLNIISAGGFY